jgi:hypothetical protein
MNNDFWYRLATADTKNLADTKNTSFSYHINGIGLMG